MQIPKGILLELERDASKKGTEIVIVNHNTKTNEEGNGVQVFCYDDGRIEVIIV